MNTKIWKLILPAILLMNACKKDDVVIPVTPVVSTAGVYALSEGTFSSNNTRLAYYDFATGTVSGNIYNTANSADLGDTGNDMIIYGSKLYIVMNVTSNVTVLNSENAKLIKKIDFKNGTINKEPRYAVAANGKVYVSAYDGSVSVIDTTTLTITKNITVGSNPEGLAIYGKYLYVANSGGLNFPAPPDSTVSVIDLTTETEIKKVTVGPNPINVAANSTGDIYVGNYGVFGSINPQIYVISGATNTFKTKLDTSLQYSHVRIYNDVAYLYNTYGGTGTCKLLDTKTNTILRNEFIIDGTVVTNPYGINIDDTNGDVYITDSKDFSSSGAVFCFDKTGKKKFSFSTTPGISPNTIAFIRK